MPPRDPNSLGSRIAAARRSRRLTQAELADQACVSLPTVKAVEQDKRRPSESVLEAIAEALAIDPERLLGTAQRTNSRIHAAVPALRAAADTHDLPEDGPVRPLGDLRAAVVRLERLRLASRYSQLAKDLPKLLAELARAQDTLAGAERMEASALLASAYRSTDSVLYKYGYHDLSARYIDLMRRAAETAGDPVLEAAAAYVRMEVFFSSRTPQRLSPGLRMLQRAIDEAPAPASTRERAAIGALHMRAAVVAGRMKDESAALLHLGLAKPLAQLVPEGVYGGTAFGVSSFRVHQVSVAVELGDGPAALSAARKWKPAGELPAERRSHYYIDVARAQFWENLGDDAHESLQVARRIAPQHVHEHPQVREMLRSLVRTQRSNRDSLLGFATWVGVV